LSSWRCAGRHVEREVGEAARRAPPVDEDVLFVQVPAARPHHDRRQRVIRIERVGLALFRGEVDRPVQRVLKVELALDHVGPQRRIGVLEVGQPDIRAGIKRVYRHFLVGRPGDLHPPVDETRRRCRDPPRVVGANVLGFLQEVEHRPAGQLCLPAPAGRQRFGSPVREGVVEHDKQLQGRG
jgi:hypothetical protein